MFVSDDLHMKTWKSNSKDQATSDDSISLYRVANQGHAKVVQSLCDAGASSALLVVRQLVLSGFLSRPRSSGSPNSGMKQYE